jgi:hypothetical protein
MLPASMHFEEAIECEVRMHDQGKKWGNMWFCPVLRGGLTEYDTGEDPLWNKSLVL